MKLPTDLAVLQTIYDMNLPAYAARTGKGGNSPFLPIDLHATASALGCNVDVLFGRLYYHLSHKYGTTDERGQHIKVFEKIVGPDRHCVHFPYLAAVLAQMIDERRQRRISWGLTGGALLVSIVALAISLWPRHEAATPGPVPHVTAPAPRAEPST
jgi:hypothetical protein